MSLDVLVRLSTMVSYNIMDSISTIIFHIHSCSFNDGTPIPQLLDAFFEPKQSNVLVQSWTPLVTFYVKGVIHSIVAVLCRTVLIHSSIILLV
jgi:Fe2+ transport system protein B